MTELICNDNTNYILNIDIPGFESALSSGLLEHIEAKYDYVESVHNITAESFFENYFFPQKPVLVKGGCKHWPAYNAFSSEYLKSKTINKTVILDAYSLHPVEQLLHNFFDELNSGITKHYLQELSLLDVDNGLSMDLLDSDFCMINNKIFEIFGCQFRSLWIGTDTATTFLHKDVGSTSTLHFSLYGRKRWVIMHPSTFLNEKDHDSKNYYKFISNNHQYVKHILVDAGDMLFVPANYYHRVSGVTKLNASITTQLLHPDHLNAFIRCIVYDLSTALNMPLRMNSSYLAVLKARFRVIREFMLKNNVLR